MGIGIPDKTGRSSGRLSGRAGKAMGPPRDGPWVPLARELLQSPAWRARSFYGRILVDFLLIEHMNRAGQENGYLAATYQQLADFGIPKKYISSTLFEVIQLRLIERTIAGGRNRCARYRLTFLPVRGVIRVGNEWKSVSEAAAEGVAHDVRSMRHTARGRRVGYRSSKPDEAD